MQEVEVDLDGDRMTLWDFSSIHLQLSSYRLSLPHADLSNIMQSVHAIEHQLTHVLQGHPTQHNWRESLARFLEDKLFGSFEQMRVEMELRFKAERVVLTTADRTKLHCYWVPCAEAAREEGSEEDEDDGGVRDNERPTMIFCNPNAGFIEYFQYQSDWLEYYINMGINVFVWNYRGFGNSEGTPSPKVTKFGADIKEIEVRLRNCGSLCQIEDGSAPKGWGSRLVDGRHHSSLSCQERPCRLPVHRSHLL
jgi:hypothetical protein